METLSTLPRRALRASVAALLALTLGCALPHFSAQPAIAAPAPTPNSAPSISGRLTDATGHSLVGVTVAYFDEANHQNSGQTTTDSNGRYSFARLNGHYSITPRATDAAFLPPKLSVTVTASNVQSADFVGYHTPYIVGRVTAAPTGDVPGGGVAGVTVQRVGRKAPAASTVTDAAGYYGFSDVPVNYYALILSKAGYGFLPPGQSVTIGARDKGRTVNFSALQGAYVSGRVTQLDGTGVGRIGVVLQASAGAARVTLANDAGYYGFSDVGAGTYTLIARGPAYNLLPPFHSLTTDGKGSVRHIDFTVLATPFISGRITTSAGSGLQNVLVTLRQESSSPGGIATIVRRTDDAGYYGFSQVAAGTYLVTPTLSGYTFRPPLQSITIDPTGAKPRVSYPGLDFIGLVAATTPAHQVSPVTLSTTQINANAATIQLRFSGALDAATASEPTLFTVTIDGRPTAVQSASYNAVTHTITLALAEPSLAANSPVTVKWSGLLDTNQLTVTSSRLALWPAPHPLAPWI